MSVKVKIESPLKLLKKKFSLGKISKEEARKEADRFAFLLSESIKDVAEDDLELAVADIIEVVDTKRSFRIINSEDKIMDVPVVKIVRTMEKGTSSKEATKPVRLTIERFEAKEAWELFHE